jgi:hypothetical protein
MPGKIETTGRTIIGNNTFSIKGVIEFAGDHVKGDQHNEIVLPADESGKIADQIKVAFADAKLAAEQMKAELAGIQDGTLQVPDVIFSDDFVAKKIERFGAIYKLDRTTIDQENNYRYKRVFEE